MSRNPSYHPFKVIQCMSGLLSQYFCSRGHVSFVKTPVSQMGPCQVGCSVFMLPHPPILTMERLVGGVYNEQSIRFLMHRVCFPNLVLSEHCWSKMAILA